MDQNSLETVFFKCNLSPVGRQKAIKNSVSNDFDLNSLIALTFSIATYPVLMVFIISLPSHKQYFLHFYNKYLIEIRLYFLYLRIQFIILNHINGFVGLNNDTTDYPTRIKRANKIDKSVALSDSMLALM